MGLADSKQFLHLVRSIVADPTAGSQAWGQASQTPKATTHRLLRMFRFHGALDRSKADPRRVIQLAADLRKDRAIPYTTVYRKAVLDSIKQNHEGMQLAFQSAANRYGFFEESTMTVRIDKDHVGNLAPGVSGSGALHTDPDGRFVESRRRPLVVVYVDDLSRFPPPTWFDDVAVTDPIITYVDLLSHPRAGAHAEFLDGALVRAGLLPERT